MKVSKIHFTTDEGDIIFIPETKKDEDVAESIALAFNKEAQDAGEIKGIILALLREDGTSIGVGGTPMELFAGYAAIKESIAERTHPALMSIIDEGIQARLKSQRCSGERKIAEEETVNEKN